jgi:hypothetical protein
MSQKRQLVPADILPMADYSKRRGEERRRVLEIKRRRRVDVGPIATFYFECYDTMWLQVHEMLLIEKASPAQAPDEIAAYNPLIPKGDELVATLMIEIDDAERRQRELARLGGIERTAFIACGGRKIRGAAEEDAERTTPDGKASSVQFVHFRFTPEEIAAFRQQGAQATLGLEHPNYGHIAILPEAVRVELASDFD